MEIKKYAKRTYSIRQFEPFDISTTITLDHTDLPEEAQKLPLEDKYNILDSAVNAMLVDGMQTEYEAAKANLQQLMKKFPVEK